MDDFVVIDSILVLLFKQLKDLIRFVVQRFLQFRMEIIRTGIFHKSVVRISIKNCSTVGH